MSDLRLFRSTSVTFTITVNTRRIPHTSAHAWQLAVRVLLKALQNRNRNACTVVLSIFLSGLIPSNEACPQTDRLSITLFDHLFTRTLKRSPMKQPTALQRCTVQSRRRQSGPHASRQTSYSAERTSRRPSRAARLRPRYAARRRCGLRRQSLARANRTFIVHATPSFEDAVRGMAPCVPTHTSHPTTNLERSSSITPLVQCVVTVIYKLL